MDEAREEALRYVRRKRTFFLILGIWLALSVMWFLIDLLSGGGLDWFFWPMLGTGIFVAVIGVSLFGLAGLFGPDWERREVDRYLRQHRTEDPGAAE
jgi:hypothetical protein